MIAKVRDRLSYANVMATIAVFLALAGVAGASGLLKKNSVTSKTIKDGQVKSADLHNGAVTESKIAPNSVTGAAVKDDSLTGADIDESSLKLSTTSPYATISSGATVTGAWNYYSPPGAEIDLVEAFPALAPVAPTDATVNFGADALGLSGDKDPACTGDSSSPTAPPGEVCIYIDNGTSTSEALIGDALQRLPTDPTSRYGFEIKTKSGGNGRAGGTWAYTAP